MSVLEALLHARSNVLPMDVDAGRDFFTEGSPAALRGVLASWSQPECRAWCAWLCCRHNRTLLMAATQPSLRRLDANSASVPPHCIA